MNHKDAILQDLTPLVPVPRFEALAPDTRGDGHRFLAAGDGLWVEIETPWLHVRQPIAVSAIGLPFGTVEQLVRFKCGALPKVLLEEFVRQAREASPRETAAIITWKPETREFALIAVALDAGTAHVHYERPRLAKGVHLVADLHSHGRFPARFSGQDDEDDFGEVKLAVVVGECDTDNPSIAVRLCALGLFIPLAMSGERGSEKGACLQPHGTAA